MFNLQFYFLHLSISGICCVWTLAIRCSYVDILIRFSNLNHILLLVSPHFTFVVRFTWRSTLLYFGIHSFYLTLSCVDWWLEDGALSRPYMWLPHDHNQPSCIHVVMLPTILQPRPSPLKSPTLYFSQLSGAQALKSWSKYTTAHAEIVFIFWRVFYNCQPIWISFL